MAYDTGFSRRSSSERDLQPVAIVSVDPTSRVAVGATRTRHTIRINCAYATGDTITVPAVGEQWYVERFDAEWRLYGRIPFNDPTLNIEPEEGQVSVGSASGPLELNGTEVRANGTFRLDGVYFRDTGTQFERSTDKKTWTAIGGGTAGVVQIISEALAHYTGTDQALATAALKSWGGGLDKVAENFTLLWDLLCGNVFVSGLKRLGVGASDVERIIDGFQNFVNYLFGVVFCDFTGDLDPQTILARLRDLLAPVINNPLVQALATVATALEVGTGNLLGSVVAGLTGLFDLLRDLFLVNPFNLESLAAFQEAVAKIATVVAAVGDQALAGIVGLFGDVLNAIVNNPVTLIVKEFFNNELFNPVIGEDPDTGEPLRLFDAITNGSLFMQIVDGTKTVFYTFAKMVTEVLLPIDPSDWQTLLPFIPAEVWEGIAAATLPDLGEGFLGGLGVILKIAFKALENFLALGADAISNFFKNIVTLFGDVSSFFTVLFTGPQEAINYVLTDVLKIAEMGVDGVVTFISDFIGNAGGAITTLLENLLALFGINFTPTDAEGNPLPFNAANAITDFIFKIFSGESLNTFLSVAFGGVFGSTLTEVSRFFNRIINMFGLTLSSFTDIASFNFAAAASGFINAVLVNAPAVAIQTFQSFFTIAGTLVYDMAKGIIEVISKVPLFGPPVAGTLTALLNAFVGGQRGYVNSGSNLLIDPGVENDSFWKQAGSSRATAPKRSAGGSLFVSGGTYVWFNVNDLGEVSPTSTRPDEVMHAECYVYSYYYTYVHMYARATDSTTGTYQDYYCGYGSVGPGDWTKVTGDVRIPSPWDRIQFGIYTIGGYPVYIDDMLVREVTDANTVSNTVTNLTQSIYGQGAGTPTIGQTKIPQGSVLGSSGSGTLSGDIGSSASGTGLLGAVYGANGSGGLLGTGGKIPNLNNWVTGNTQGTGTGGLNGTVGSAASGTGLAGAMYGSTGLLARLYGGTTNAAITQRIQQSALPAELKTAVGSGVSLIRAYDSSLGSGELWNGAYYNPPIRSATPGRNRLITDYFNRVETANSSSDLSVIYSGNAVAVNATNPGWYLIVVSYGINTGNTQYGTGGTSYYNYNWGLTPLLYITPSDGNTASPYTVIRSGNDAVHRWATSAQGTFGWAPRCVQSSWIVYLPNAYGSTAVRPGYDFSGHLVGTTNSSDALFKADPYGVDTYFSVSLLNRSLL